MLFLYRAGLIISCLAVGFASGFFHGQRIGRKVALKGAVIAYQKRERINGDVSKLNDIDLCIALGGLPDECASLVLGMAESLEDKKSGKNDQK
ncbi:MAG: hypothetical protein JSC189_000448 [Candidatus Tokpelaia sp. JSC189]|nr:MAG: hypothetical protein JSC189_000448 [Candidatus Tokpelaia sp. JSC189]